MFIQFISKPLEKLTFFLICLLCIIPPTINHFLILYHDIDTDILIVQYFAIAVTISYILTAMVYVLRKWKIIEVFSYIFLIGLLLLFFFLKITFGTNISPLLTTTIAETNIYESLEFLQYYVFCTKTLVSILICLVTLVIAILSIKILLNKYSYFIKNASSIIIIICFIISLTSLRIVKSLYECKNMNDINEWYNKYYPYAMDNISTLLYSIYIPQIASNEVISVIKKTKESIDKQANIINNDSLDVIFIIGESYIKYHAHLYGYYLPTTPNMDREHKNGNLFIFNDIISPYNSTTLVIKNVLCTNSISDNELWSESIFFPSIFKHAGFNVYMWDNQKNLGSFLIYTFTINFLLYNKDIMDMSYTKTNTKTYQYDGDLLKSYFSIKTAKHNFSIFHLMGQHVLASKRYPKEFSKFTANNIQKKDKYLNHNKKQYIAEYDNATLYNDYVLNMLFDKYRNKNAVIVYTSDHGEEVYDVRDEKGRNLDYKMDKNIIKYQNDVPLIVWCSDKYMSLHPKIIKDLLKSINKKGMIDNTYILLLRLAGIQTSLYNPERDISSSKYINKKRIIYDRFNYDIIK